MTQTHAIRNPEAARRHIAVLDDVKEKGSVGYGELQERCRVRGADLAYLIGNGCFADGNGNYRLSPEARSFRAYLSSFLD